MNNSNTRSTSWYADFYLKEKQVNENRSEPHKINDGDTSKNKYHQIKNDSKAIPDAKFGDGYYKEVGRAILLNQTHSDEKGQKSLGFWNVFGIAVSVFTVFLIGGLAAYGLGVSAVLLSLLFLLVSAHCYAYSSFKYMLALPIIVGAKILILSY